MISIFRTTATILLFLNDPHVSIYKACFAGLVTDSEFLADRRDMDKIVFVGLLVLGLSLCVSAQQGQSTRSRKLSFFFLQKIRNSFKRFFLILLRL